MNLQALTALGAVDHWAIDERAWRAGFLAAVKGESAAERRARAMMTVVNGTAVLPIDGTLTPKESIWGQLFGGETTTDAVRAMLRTALADEQVGSIVLLFDSPGGDAVGVPELADEIHAARGKKPLVAHVRHLAASGAYWLASQADQVWSEPSGEVGSVGVFTIHQSYARMLEDAGIDTTIIKAGDYKAEWTPYEPLSDDAKAHAQEQVDEVYRQFVKAVARGRGVAVDQVRETYGQGRVVMAKDAKAAGMIDQIGTLDDLLVRSASGRRRGVRVEAAATDVARDLDWLVL